MKIIKHDKPEKRLLSRESKGCGCDCIGEEPGPQIQQEKKALIQKIEKQGGIRPYNQIQSENCSQPAPIEKTGYIDIHNAGYIETAAGNIPRITDKLSAGDWFGTMKVRLNINRDNYMVAPGLYAIGNPDSKSPVLASANYKLSFDHLRSNLTDINAWILVIDTKGINVWCAAGKGTFGTGEIIKRIQVSLLEKIVSHRKIILPQLGAPGVAAHIVARETGFKPVYGPVRAADLKKFLDSGMKATGEMRKIRFGFLSRLVLVPVELAIALKYILLSLLIFILFSGVNSAGFSVENMINDGMKYSVILILAFFMGTVVTPLLIPYIPGRAFSFKGLISGILLYMILYFYLPGFNGAGNLELSAWFFLIVSITSFFTMNFTGTTTYTSLSGVLKEMKIAVPLQAVAASTGILLFIISRFI
jgi:acetyl-CoA decarbonylase/synthase complex subunit gamma